MFKTNDSTVLDSTITFSMFFKFMWWYDLYRLYTDLDYMKRDEFEKMSNDHSFNQTMKSIIDKIHINPSIDIVESA